MVPINAFDDEEEIPKAKCPNCNAPIEETTRKILVITGKIV
jgi:uncharacterized protein with PIN domain